MVKTDFSSIISIIVPIYNTECFLRKCIESILSQTYSHFELLLIDDGSTDSSAKICEEYVLKDSRVRVFHKKNGGLSSARNLGLENTNGKYVTFCDSDDWINSDYLESLIPHNGEQLKCCSFSGEAWKTKVLTETSNMHDFLEYNFDKYAFGVACCKLFDNSIIQQKNIRFRNDIHIGEDIVFVSDYLSCNLCSVSSTSYQGYNYEPNVSSLSHKIVPIEESFHIIEHLCMNFQKISLMYDFDCSKMRNEYLCSQLFNILKAIKCSNKSVLWDLKQFIKIINNKSLSVLFRDKTYWNSRHFNSAIKDLVIHTALACIRSYYKIHKINK